MIYRVIAGRSGRSMRVKLAAALVLGSGLTLAACGDAPAAPSAKAAPAPKKVEVTVYENVVACAAVPGKTREQCEAMHSEAVAWADAEAQRFAALDDCERKFGSGKCVESGLARPDVLESDKGHYVPFVVAWAESPGAVNAPLFNAEPEGYQTVNGTKLEFVAETDGYVATEKALRRLNVTPPVKPASKRGKALEKEKAAAAEAESKAG